MKNTRCCFNKRHIWEHFSSIKFQWQRFNDSVLLYNHAIKKFHSHRDAQSNQQAFISSQMGVDMRGSAANTSSWVPWPTMKNVLVGGKTLSLELSWSLKLPLAQSNFHARRYASFASELYTTDIPISRSVLDTSIRPWSETKSATHGTDRSASWLCDSKINCVWI